MVMFARLDPRLRGDDVFLFARVMADRFNQYYAAIAAS